MNDGTVIRQVHPDEMPTRVVGDELRLTDPDAPEVVEWIAVRVEQGHPAYCTFAAEGGAAGIVWTPVGLLEPARPKATYPLSRLGVHGLDGSVSDTHTLIARVTGDRDTSAAWTFDLTFHDPDTVNRHLCPNGVDALPLTVLLNLVELARCQARGIDPNRLIAGGADSLFGLASRWQAGHDRGRWDEDYTDLGTPDAFRGWPR